MPMGEWSLMDDKVKQIFLISFGIFALLIWHNYNQPSFHDSTEYREYQTYMNQKIQRIIDEKNGTAIQSERSISSGATNCIGCCPNHGGVICHNGKTVCKKGLSHLSFTCQNNGCNACPVINKLKKR